MSGLKSQIIQDMQLGGLVADTPYKYVRGVRCLAQWAKRSPDELGRDEVRAFLLHLKDERKASPSVVKSALAGLKFFYEVTLARPDVTAGLAWPMVKRRLPIVLLPKQVALLLDQAADPRLRNVEERRHARDHAPG